MRIGHCRVSCHCMSYQYRPRTKHYTMYTKVVAYWWRRIPIPIPHRAANQCGPRCISHSLEVQVVGKHSVYSDLTPRGSSLALGSGSEREFFHLNLHWIEPCKPHLQILHTHTSLWLDAFPVPEAREPINT